MATASSSIAAAMACSRTILFDSLRINAFDGAIPHVMLVVDKVPNVIQKHLLQGYRLVLDEYNGASTDALRAQSEQGDFFVSLDPKTSVNSGSFGFTNPCMPKVSYSIVAFQPENFLEKMKTLQRFLRYSGDKSIDAEVFKTDFSDVSEYLLPFGEERTSENELALTKALQEGPQRELLCFILSQKEAFQNEMKKYRLRLSLFDLGTRVAEHCHLASMSEDADLLANEGKYIEALCHDQVFSYARSCSLKPSVAQRFGVAIADTIDSLSWRRNHAGPTSSITPRFAHALQDDTIWELFEAGAIRWNGASSFSVEEGAADEYPSSRKAPIVGVGQPLKIVSKESENVLEFIGGLEDCLLNTGYYPAAETEERNSVEHHRARFLVESVAKKNTESAASPDLEAVKGRMKKKDYLAKLQAEGLKPNKKKRVDSDDEESTMVAHSGGAQMTSSIGGTFPIGEVISESFDLSKLNGKCTIFAYPDCFKNVTMSKPKPFTLVVQNGIVVDVSADAPEDFVDLLTLVRQAEGECYVRELGIGLNPYVGRDHALKDVTSFERQWGVHLSLGQRHPLFVKQRAKLNEDGTLAENVKVDGPVLKRKAGKYHIDVFVDVEKIVMGDFEMDFNKSVMVR